MSSVFSHSLLPRSPLKLKGCAKHGTQTNSPCSVAHTTFLPIIRCDKHERGQSKGQATQQSCHTKLLKHAHCSVGLLKASRAVGREHQTCSKMASWGTKMGKEENPAPCTSLRTPTINVPFRSGFPILKPYNWGRFCQVRQEIRLTPRILGERNLKFSQSFLSFVHNKDTFLAHPINVLLPSENCRIVCAGGLQPSISRKHNLTKCIPPSAILPAASTSIKLPSL